ncbi:MAG: 3-oxoacyl-ACP reductase family protein [bacterium]
MNKKSKIRNPKSEICIVTGASRGLGRAIAVRFSLAGYCVVVTYRQESEKAKEVVRQIGAARALACRANIARENEVEAMIEETLERWGRIDILVNNAGLTRDNLLIRLKDEEWTELLETNLRGAFHCIKAVAPVMAKGGGGHIINISSLVGIKGGFGQANYAASKSALIGLTRSAAVELGPQNIKVNAVLPGYLLTDMGLKAGVQAIERVKKENCLGRLSEVNEIADFVCHLAQMNNVSGQIFNLDSRIGSF